MSPTPDETASAIVGLIEAGYENQIVMSHDLFLKQMWTQNGGNGFAYVTNVFLELLKSKGVSAQTCAALVTTHPQRLLTA